MSHEKLIGEGVIKGEGKVVQCIRSGQGSDKSKDGIDAIYCFSLNSNWFLKLCSM